MMTDKIDECISDIIAIASSERGQEGKRRRAELSIGNLLRDAHFQEPPDGRFKTAQDLRERLGRAISSHHGDARQSLDRIIAYLDALLGRDGAQ